MNEIHRERSICFIQSTFFYSRANTEYIQRDTYNMYWQCFIHTRRKFQKANLSKLTYNSIHSVRELHTMQITKISTEA